MSSFGNDKPNALRNVSVGRRSGNRYARNPSTSVSSDTTSSSRDDRQASLPSIENVTSVQSRSKALKVSYPPGLDNHGSRRERQHNSRKNLSPQISSQGMNGSYGDDNQYFRGGRLPSPEVQSLLHSTSPYYIASQPAGVLYPSQYGTVGYPSNAVMIPSFSPAYSPHTVGPGLNSQFFGSWGSNTHLFDLPYPNKFNGQLEFQPSFANLYNVHGQLDSLASFDHGPQHQGVAVQVIDPGNLVNMGFHMPIPNSNLTSPGMPGSPIGVYNFPGGRSDVSSPSSSRSAGFYGGWQGLRGNDNANYQKPYSFLEELKSVKGRRFELSDISGRVVELSVDQHGSRFIQQKLEKCSVEDKAAVFEELVPDACKLMTDVFGNYVIQKFFEYGTSDQRQNLAKTLAGEIIRMSLHTYGCRVVQKAFDVIELDQRIEITNGLNGHVMRCVRDQNGNHVIQKCIECVPSERIGFILSTFRGQVYNLSIHPYGCRVIQRVLEHCTDELQNQFVMDEIMESVCNLTQDQYGNYVIQHVLEKGKPQEKTQIIKQICGQVVKMSQHKFASNVIEKCLEYGDAPSRELLVAEVVGQTEGNDNLLVMMKDKYANYVVQRILDTCAESQRELLLGRIKLHLNALKKYTFGKHIVTRFEQLFGEIQVLTSQ